MDKKNSSFPTVKGIHGIYRLILLSLFFVALVFADSRKVVINLETYFSELDSALSTIGQDMAKYGAKRAKEPLEKMLQDHLGIEFLIWANSKGVVVNEAVREGKPGKPHRNLSRQKWFEKIKNITPYYSSLKTRKGDHKLFWCKPIRVTKSGRDHSGGAIVARIDLKRTFDSLAKKIKTPFRVLQKGQPFFSHAWEMSYDSTAVPLTIKGIDDIQINAKKQQTVLESSTPETTKKIAWGAVFKSKLIIAFVVIAIAFLVLLSIVKVVVKMKNDALMRRIEGEKPSVEPDKSFDKPRKKELTDDDVDTAETILSEQKEEDLPHEAKDALPPDDEEEVILEPAESTAKEAAAVTQPEEFSAVAKKKEVKSDTPAKQEEILEMDSIPSETQVLQSDIVDAIKAVKPEEEADDITVVTEEEEAEDIPVAPEEEPKTISPDIMEQVEALLQKHVHSVLAERAKQIEEDVLARVKDELAGRKKDQKE